MECSLNEDVGPVRITGLDEIEATEADLLHSLILPFFAAVVKLGRGSLATRLPYRSPRCWQRRSWRRPSRLLGPCRLRRSLLVPPADQPIQGAEGLAVRVRWTSWGGLWGQDFGSLGFSVWLMMRTNQSAAVAVSAWSSKACFKRARPACSAQAQPPPPKPPPPPERAANSSRRRKKRRRTTTTTSSSSSSPSTSCKSSGVCAARVPLTQKRRCCRYRLKCVARAHLVVHMPEYQGAAAAAATAVVVVVAGRKGDVRKGGGTTDGGFSFSPSLFSPDPGTGPSPPPPSDPFVNAPAPLWAPTFLRASRTFFSFSPGQPVSASATPLLLRSPSLSICECL